MAKKVGIVGLGALGILFGQKLSEGLGKENVYVFADKERITRYQKNGVYANGQKCEFTYIEGKDAPEVDVLIFATKYYDLEEAALNAAGACGNDTIVISLLNGVSSESLLEKLLHPANLLYCVAQGMDAVRAGNQLTYSKAGCLVIGEKDGEESGRVKRLAGLFEKVGIAYEISKDILHGQWSKWMLNVGVNQTCAAYEVGYREVQSSGMYHEAVLAAMREAKEIAGVEGIDITEDELENWIKILNSLSPDGEPSMRQDTRAGRKTEVELFAGLVCALGKKHGIQTPQNEKYYQMLT